MFKKTVQNDKTLRNIYLKNESKRRLPRILIENLKVKKLIRTHYNLKLNLEFKKKTSLVKIRNRCIISGRGRSIYRDFRLSRMQLRHLASFGILMGIKKSSW